MFDESTNIVLVKAIQSTVPLRPGGFIQKVAVPRPEDTMDPSPKLVMLFMSSVSKKSKSERSLWM